MNFGIYKKHIPKKKKKKEKYDKVPTINKEDSRWSRLLTLMNTFESNTKPSEPPIINVTVEQAPLPMQPPLQYNPEFNSGSSYQRVRDYYTSDKADANADIAYRYLTGDKWKMSPIMASGIIGNLYHENLANPSQTIQDARGTIAFGAPSFNSSGLLSDFEGYAKERALDKNELTTQLDYIADYIINKKDPNLTREMLRPDLTPEHASFVFGRYFERFAGRDGTGKGFLNYDDDEHDRRRKRSLLIYNKYNKQ